jgi:hypothetical protein
MIGSGEAAAGPGASPDESLQALEHVVVLVHLEAERPPPRHDLDRYSDRHEPNRRASGRLGSARVGSGRLGELNSNRELSQGYAILTRWPWLHFWIDRPTCMPR